MDLAGYSPKGRKDLVTMEQLKLLFVSRLWEADKNLAGSQVK